MASSQMKVYVLVVLLAGCASVPHPPPEPPQASVDACPAGLAMLELESATTIYKVACVSWDDALRLIIGARYDGRRLIDWQVADHRY